MNTCVVNTTGCLSTTQVSQADVHLWGMPSVSQTRVLQAHVVQARAPRLSVAASCASAAFIKVIVSLQDKVMGQDWVDNHDLTSQGAMI